MERDIVGQVKIIKTHPCVCRETILKKIIFKRSQKEGFFWQNLVKIYVVFYSQQNLSLQSEARNRNSLRWPAVPSQFEVDPFENGF